MNNFGKVGGTDLFFAFADKHEIDGKLLPCCLESVQGAEEGGFRTFLVDGAATDAGFAQALLVDQSELRAEAKTIRRDRTVSRRT